jgi:hypothetical protein
MTGKTMAKQWQNIENMKTIKNVITQKVLTRKLRKHTELEPKGRGKVFHYSS